MKKLVKIAVGMNEKGQYNAVGWTDADKKDLREMAFEPIPSEDAPEVVYFIEAYLDIPVNPVVQLGNVGRVVEVEKLEP